MVKKFSDFLNESSIFIRSIDDIKIIWNDNEKHDLVKRLQVRTNVNFEKIKFVFEKAFTIFINKKLQSGAYVLNLTKSKFKIILLWNTRKIIVKTILSTEIRTKTSDIQIDINECVEFFKLSDICNGTYLDTILIESSLDNINKYEAFLINCLVEKNIIDIDI